MGTRIKLLLAILILAFAALSGCAEYFSSVNKGYMAQCQKTCGNQGVMKVSEYICECNDPNANTTVNRQSDSGTSENHGGGYYNRSYTPYYHGPYYERSTKYHKY